MGAFICSLLEDKREWIVKTLCLIYSILPEQLCSKVERVIANWDRQWDSICHWHNEVWALVNNLVKVHKQLNHVAGFIRTISFERYHSISSRLVTNKLVYRGLLVDQKKTLICKLILDHPKDLVNYEKWKSPNLPSSSKWLPMNWRASAYQWLSVEDDRRDS